MEIVVHIPQSVFDQAIGHFTMPESIALPRLFQEVRRPRHILHPAGDDNACSADRDCIGGHHDGHEARAAHLVHGCGAHGMRDPRADRGLPGRRLPKPCRQHAAHIDIVHLIARDAGAFERVGNHDAPEFRGRHIGEDTIEASQGGSHRADNNRSLLCVHACFSGGRSARLDC